MKLRRFEPVDAETICGWNSDEHTHFMWCANKLSFPLVIDRFCDEVSQFESDGEHEAYVAFEDDKPVGFFIYRNEPSSNGFFKFVMVDSSVRGKGYGKQMISLAIEQAKTKYKAKSVELNAFADNPSAVKCYQACGFEIRRTDKGKMQYRGESWDCHNMYKEI